MWRESWFSTVYTLLLYSLDLYSRTELQTEERIYVFGRWCRLSGGCAIIITSKKKSSSRLSGGCAIVITTGKKSSSCLSSGCAIVITTGKKVLVVCLAGARLLLRPEKTVLVVCLAGARCIEFECIEFVLVLVQIDLIHFEHSICISSTCIKTDTNPLVQLKLKLIHICYCTDSHIEVQIRILLKDK